MTRRREHGVGPQENIQTTVMLVTACGVEVIAGKIDAAEPDLALVDALMRLQLAAKRRGWRVCVRDPPPLLVSLLELVGLADQLRDPAAPEARTPGTAPDR
jgi:hypothetical protein